MKNALESPKKRFMRIGLGILKTITSERDRIAQEAAFQVSGQICASMDRIFNV